MTIQERFVGKYRVTETGCWEWLAARTRAGYGVFTVDGACVRVHRYAYELYNGPVPDGMVVDHLCRNRACVNPAHLEAVRNVTNVLRGTGPSAQNVMKTHCPKGHPYDDENTCYSNGRRHCRTCKRERAYAKRHRRIYPAFCPKGHPFDAANTYVTLRGHRRCRECKNARARARRAVKKSLVG